MKSENLLNNLSSNDNVKVIEAILQLNPNPIVFADEDGVIIKLNKKAEELFGYENLECNGLDIEHIISIGMVDETIMRDDLGIGLVESNTIKDSIGLHKDGSKFPIGINFSSLRDTDDKYILCTVTDSSKQKKVEDRFKKALDISWGYIEFDTKGFILEVNDYFVESAGYSDQAELVGQHHSILCDKEYVKSKEYKQFWIDLAEGKSNTGEFKRISKEGRLIYLNASYAPIIDEDGEVLKIMKIAADVTDQRLIEERFKKALDTSWAYIEFDTNGFVIGVNDYFISLFGYESQDVLIGQHHSVFCASEYVESDNYKQFWIDLSEGKSHSGEFTRFSKSGKEIYLNASYVPVLDEKGIVVKVMEIAADVTATKGIQAQLIESEKMASLGQLIAGIAHEINTPMGAIKATVESMMSMNHKIIKALPGFINYYKDHDSEVFFDFLEETMQDKPNLSTREERKIKRKLRNDIIEKGYPNDNILKDILADMLFVGSLERYDSILRSEDNINILDMANLFYSHISGASNINLAADKCRKIVFALKSFSRVDYSGDFADMSLIDNIETVLVLYQNQLKYGINVIKNYEEIPLLLGLSDALNQVWTNLIHNAIQAMENKGQLTISITNEQKFVRVSINDNGSGIPSEIQDKIFNVFYTTKAAGEGSGLGLDIVKKIVNKHAGKIYLESEPNNTTFHVEIPKKEYILDLIKQNTLKDKKK